MKTFEVTVKLDGTSRIESPGCPSQWHGSGCYDIDVPAWCKAYVGVNAETEQEAKEIARKHEYDDSEMESVESVTVISVKELQKCYFDGDVDVEYCDVELYEKEDYL